MKQNNQTIKDNDMNKQNNNTTIVKTIHELSLRVKAIRELPLRIVRNGMLLAIGFFGTTILAVAISGTIKTWTAGEVLKSADLNTTIASLQTAIQNIPNWTKAANGNDAYYTAGNVGIGTTSPGSLLEVSGAAAQFRLADTTSTNPIFNFYEGATRAATVESYLQDLYVTTKGAKDIIFRTNNTEKMRITSSGNVGIGTTSPSTKIDVVSNYAASFRNSSSSTDIDGGFFGIGVSGFSDQTGVIRFFDSVAQGSTNEFFVIKNSAGGSSPTAGLLNIKNSSGSIFKAQFNGNITIPGALSKGSGTFDIAHPDPSMPKNARLRHSFVESPTAGDNIYRWQIKVTRENGKFFIKLPKYWTHLNTNPMVWVSSADQPAASYGYVDTTQEKVIVQADRVGTYNVLLLGTRKDSLATNNWKELGMEYISKGIGEAEKILSYNAQPEFGEEPQEQKSLRLRSGNDLQAANEKKLLALEEDNKRLREMVETHGRASLRLEDRLRAIENMQMARK